MLDGIYIIKNSGLSFASVDSGKLTDYDVDLMSPFFSALSSFTSETFNGVIKTIIMDDENGHEKQVYFKDIKVHDTPFKIVAIFGKNKASYKQIDSAAMQMKWAMQEKGWHRYLEGGQVPEHVKEEIEAKIRTLFDVNQQPGGDLHRPQPGFQGGHGSMR